MLENQPEIDYHIYKTYQILGMLGKGTYGQVYKVRHKKNNQILAIKKICDAYQNVTDAKRTYRQLNYLFQLSHPCIVKLYQVIPGNPKNFYPVRQTNTSRTQLMKGIYDEHQIGYNTQKTHDGTKQSPKMSKHVYALFQYVQTDLSKALRRCVMQPIQRKYIAYQILNGINYLHKSKLIHRDIKPSNILIDTNCDIKICDFGLCRLKQEKNHQNQYDQNIITEYVASRWYRAPQILLGFSPCNQPIDMWGVGCLFAELVLRNPIFQGESTMDQLQKIFRIIGLPAQNQISNLETQHAKFLLRTFTFSRKNQPQRMSEVLNQASDQQLDLISKLLKFKPLDRLSAEQALKHEYFSQMKEMNYDLGKFNIPVKINDPTQPSFLLQDLKSLNFQNDQRSITSQSRNSVKKKQISLEQYQNLIQDLQRETSRSSNRILNQLQYKIADKVVQSNSDSEKGLKQKSTRESNFMLGHKMGQKKDQSQQTSKLLETYNIQKSFSSSQKNLAIADLVKQGRNAYSTMDNYYNNHNQNYDFKSTNDLFLSPNNDKLHFNSNCNKSMEDNLEQNYGVFFNPFEKQNKNKLKNLSKKNPQTAVQQNNFKKSLGRKVSKNKSSSKLSAQNKKQPSFAKNKQKNVKAILTKQLDQNKNKYKSYTSLHNATQSNYLGQIKLKIPIIKKLKQQQTGNLNKDLSKNKISGDIKKQKTSIGKNIPSSAQNQKNISIERMKKLRKKSKDFLVSHQQQLNDFGKKEFENSISDKQNLSNQNHFRKIHIKQRDNLQQNNYINQVKKKTIQIKSQKNIHQKSIPKKKSQTKILSKK